MPYELSNTFSVDQHDDAGLKKILPPSLLTFLAAKH